MLKSVRKALKFVGLVESKPHFFSVADWNGDTRYDFDLTEADEVQRAMDKFAELVSNHRHWVAARYADGTTKIVKGFDPSAVEHSFHRPLAGG